MERLSNFCVSADEATPGNSASQGDLRRFSGGISVSFNRLESRPEWAGTWSSRSGYEVVDCLGRDIVIPRSSGTE